MRSPAFTTLLMALTAAATSIVAAWFYPWPEVAARSELVGKPLFESFEAKDVRTITITEFDADRNGVKQIALRRSGDTWIIPARQNFVASNSEQISQAINSVNANVLEQRSNDLQDHVEYGVVDPLEFESTRARNSLGKKIVLQDRNNRELASLIVGGSPRDDANSNKARRFVRIAGKPGVYVVELPEEALTTNFANWVSPNLFDLKEITELKSVTIESYRSSKEQLIQADRPKTWRYLLEIYEKTQTLKIPNSSNELKATPIKQEQMQSIRQVVASLANVPFIDARKKNKSLAELLKQPNAELNKGLERLTASGFVATLPSPSKADGLNFESVGGKLIVQRTDGVLISFLVGDLVEAQGGTGSDLNRLVMLYASFNPGFFPEPTKPAANADDSQQKAYLRSVGEREAKIKEASSRARLLNGQYADWFYVMSEKVIEDLIPELGIELKLMPETKPAADANSPTDSPTSVGADARPPGIGPTDPFETPGTSTADPKSGGDDQ
jgi:hypothetical protein